MKLDVININGEETGRKIDLPKDIFEIEPNEHVVYLAIKQFLANQRQGTHQTKERNQITGSQRKIKKQKGTGTARAGSIKNPIFRGGGRVFGPRPRDYTQKLNKKVRRLARKSVLSDKAKNGDIIVVEDFTFDQPQTKEYLNILSNLELSEVKSLFVTGDNDQILYKSGRNTKKSKIVQADLLNTYEILNAQKLVLSESSIDVIKKTFGK